MLRKNAIRIFIAGATGAAGKRLVPLLAAKGHQVTVMARKPDSVPMLRNAGVVGFVAPVTSRLSANCNGRCRSWREGFRAELVGS